MIAGLRGQGEDVSKLLQGDLTGKGSFVPWVLAILAVGAVGYIDELRPVSDAFLVLLLVVLLLSNGGFFDKFFETAGIGGTPKG